MPLRSALARHPLAIAGAVIATVSAVAFIALMIAAAAGLFTNPYAGLVIFIALPLACAIGLVLIPAGMWLQARRLRREPGAVAEWPIVDLRESRVRHVVSLVVVLAAVNVVIALVAGYERCAGWNRPRSAARRVIHRCIRSSPPGTERGSTISADCDYCHKDLSSP